MKEPWASSHSEHDLLFFWRVFPDICRFEGGHMTIPKMWCTS